ncbi:MAG: capsular polysaccharide biosynthesis protein [Desulfuromonas sp.]|nr:capsular polysaccharide biosynthesis protein [Desulfuromonas sp.]
MSSAVEGKLLPTPSGFIAHSRSVAELAGLPALLGASLCPAAAKHAAGHSPAVVGWGLKPSAARAARFALGHGLPFWRLEDGFLRSVGLGQDEPPLAIVVDDLGIYYDASTPSRLETLIAAPYAAAEQDRARALMAGWREQRMSKYNGARDYAGPLPERYVLVVDQTRGDASICHGLADPASFQTMLQAALRENPEATVLVKIHPDVMAGRKQGHYDPAALGKLSRVRVLAEDAHPATLVEQARAIYTVTSQVGFEGLLWGKRVRTFGMPFYAGWGLTEDDLSAPSRRRPVPLENLVHAVLVNYSRYLDPESGERCEVERLLAWMGLQRRMRARFPGTLYALGFSRWKKPFVRDFFQGSNVRFVNRAEKVPEKSLLAVWGRKPVRGKLPETVSLLRLEDGFLRSVGLGADLVRPLSWIMDRRGIYYDATVPSDLEQLLQTAEFDVPLLTRARDLRAAICQHGLTKYNVGEGSWRRPPGARRVILVPGQVESDASIRYGAPGIRGNFDLLRAVREANPDACLLYKPHPDVVAGLRAKGQGEGAAGQYCDEIVVDVPMGMLLDMVDEVHVLTSLAGFEALLRGRKVVTYGLPFYAGWGLTQDIVPLARRSRKLKLEELVAGVLIEYPIYVSRRTGRFTTPERALQELLLWREEGPARLPLWRQGWRLLMRLGGKQ